MRRFPWDSRRYKRDWLRGRDAPYPTPEEMFFSIASLILAVLLLGVAADFVVSAFNN